MRRVGRWLVRLLVVWLLVCAGVALAVLIYSRGDRPVPADVIIVLGSGLRPNGEPGPAMIRRVGRGAQLWRDGFAPYILCSGGVGLGQTRSEADACLDVLRGLNVPEGAVILEDRSRSTEENAIYSHERMRELNLHTALVVSDGYHLLRASWIFQANGFAFSTSRPAADPPFFDHLQAVVREVVAVNWYGVKTLFNLPVTYVPLA